MAKTKIFASEKYKSIFATLLAYLILWLVKLDICFIIRRRKIKLSYVYFSSVEFAQAWVRGLLITELIIRECGARHWWEYFCKNLCDPTAFPRKKMNMVKVRQGSLRREMLECNKNINNNLTANPINISLSFHLASSNRAIPSAIIKLQPVCCFLELSS